MNIIEEFRDCLEIGYQVSNLGNVRSLKGFHRAGIDLKVIVNPRGYLNVKLYVNSVQLTRGVHRLVAIAFIPNPFNLESVNHKDGIKENNHVDNLEWMTKLENFEHAKINGLLLKGSDHQNSKLLEADVIEIKKLLSEGTSPTKIGKLFGVSTATISQIRLNNTWVQIPWPNEYVVDLSSLHRKGSEMKTAILDENSVRAIRSRLANNEKQSKLAIEYGVTRGTMSQLALGKTWKHVV